MNARESLLRVPMIALVSCGLGPGEIPQVGHVRLHVITDAPLPVGANSTSVEDRAPPLFDRLSLEVFAPGEDRPCASDCRREFALDDDRLATTGMSVVLRPEPGIAGYRVRARLYRAAALVRDQPQPENTVEVVAELPMIGPEGGVDGTIELWTETIGRTGSSLEAPSPVLRGSPSILGSWPGAARTHCSSPGQAGEVCVPGGAFWMGDRSVGLSALGSDVPGERLVILSPFYLDETEVTVGQFRRSGLATAQEPTRWSGTRGSSVTDWCTYTDAPRGTAEEALPVNCIGWELASAYCRSRGGDLPSEAQFEYAAGAGRGQLYVWGIAEPSCADAVWGRAGYGITAQFYGTCRAPGDTGGAMPVRSGVRDRFVPGSSGDRRTIHGLAGNVFEWSRDTWNRQDEPCWRHPLLRDPTCTLESPLHSVRGGGWPLNPAALRAAHRQVFNALEFEVARAAVGFRCARSALER